jgi:Flp pilus assembly protein TadG
MRDQTGKVIESVAACRQRGVVLPLVAVGMLAMLALAGLAMDASHALANKARMQNTADAAALAAAKTYDETADVVAGNAAALAIFGQNADGVGNHEMNVAFDGGEINIVIQWSQTLNPFVSTGVGPYVRVIATGLDVDASLSAIVGISEIPVGATAVAGPSPSIDNACNIAPLVVCANDPDDTDLFGFEANQLEVLKSSSGGTEEIGPGNYQLIRLDCPGGDCVRENLAGSWDGCLADDDIVETEPGNTVGPSVQGLNTRFNDYGGAGMNPEDYPPDVIIKQPQPPLQYDEENDAVTQGGAVVDETTIDYGWADYKADIAANILDIPPPLGVFERRVIAIPVARCDGGATGQSDLDVVGFGCYFLLQQVKQKGNEAEIYGQFIEGCRAGGVPGPNPGPGNGPYIIQLYDDPDSVES